LVEVLVLYLCECCQSHPLQWVNGTIETIRHNVMASSLTCGEKLGVFGDRSRPVTDGATVCYRHSSFLYPRLPWSKWSRADGLVPSYRNSLRGMTGSRAGSGCLSTCDGFLRPSS